MTKVLSLNDGKQPGKTGTATKTASANEVVAIRNGKERTFTRQMWDNLPADKQGYQEVSEAPKKPTTAKTGTGTQVTSGTPLTPEQEKDLYDATAAEYKELFSEDASGDLTTSDLQKLIANKKADAGSGKDAKKTDTKELKAQLVEKYKTLTGKGNGKTLSIEKLQDAIAKAEGGNS